MKRRRFKDKQIRTALREQSAGDRPSDISQSLLRQFAQRHKLKFTDLIRGEEVLIRTSSTANILINAAYADLDDVSLADPAIGLLLNMLHRNFEHVEAAAVSFVTGCGASAEVVARTATENSINILYILSGDRKERLTSYFHHYLDDVDRQIDRWIAEIIRPSPDEARFHELGAERRRTANNLFRNLIMCLFGAPTDAWPKSIAQRFNIVGSTVAYRTFYARMSSETHGDAEETLRYFVGQIQGDTQLFSDMAMETVWMTRFYIYYSASLFLKASIAYAMSYSLASVPSRLEKELADVERELVEISSHVGAGI